MIPPSIFKFPVILLLAVLAVSCGSLQKEKSDQSDQEVFMFSYFIGNGEDGLHLAYSIDGYTWEALADGKSFLMPTAGDDKLMRDPCIIRGKDGKFHMVWTVSWNEKGLGYASSEDLVNWSSQQFIPVMEHEENARNTWAPEVFYDETEDLYMIYWATTISGLYPGTQSEEESGYNHRQYYVTTKDFKTYSETKLLYEPGFNVIDGTLVKEDGTYVLFVKDETREPAQKNIRIARSNRVTGPYGPAGPPITGDYWAEGPTVAKVGNRWIVYFDKYINHEMGAVASEDLENWEDISDEISFPEGTRHGTAFKIKKSELNFILENAPAN
ncbi:glycoside hydrolase family 43 protein [Lunatibacter salilacus]|uniref:glycoside hydrolase family 43 protein n=1 Tax=Lunatibacter salilacus TaxID=2483804 RepID=UPI00131E5648|nr:glycoside hydrolase family 43 protein [Lunatibacter salilacus]